MNTVAFKKDLLDKLVQVILEMHDLSRLSQALTEMVRETFGLEWVSLFVWEESGQAAVRAVSHGEAEKKLTTQRISIGSLDFVLGARQRIVKQRLLEEFAGQISAPLKEELEQSDTFLTLPLLEDQALVLLGVLNLGPKSNREQFSQEDVVLLSQLAQFFAAMLKEAREHHKIKAEKLHQQNILDNLICGIIAVDPAERISVFNRAAARILKVKPEEMLRKSARQLPLNLASILLDTLHQGKCCFREELNLAPENTLIGVSTAQFYDAKGKFLGACMVFTDLSEVKRKEKLTYRQNMEAYWSTLTGSLAKEVKDSIVATKIFTEMFPKKYEDAEFRWSLYSTLKRDMEKLDSFSSKMLNFAQLKELTQQPCQITQVVDAAIERALGDKDLGRIVLEKRYSQNLPPIMGDAQQLKEAFANIISNAWEAMDKEGIVTISIEQEQGPEMLIYNFPEAAKELPPGELIVVKIQDSGCGILAKDLPYLFDPFFTTKKARTGLGLAFARKIIDRHGGLIGVQSKPGEGSTFLVLLPKFSFAKIK